jgi:hypothetical protein
MRRAGVGVEPLFGQNSRWKYASAMTAVLRPSVIGGIGDISQPSEDCQRNTEPLAILTCATTSRTKKFLSPSISARPLRYQFGSTFAGGGADCNAAVDL